MGNREIATALCCRAVLACVSAVLPLAASAQVFQGQVMDVLARVEGLDHNRTCEMMNFNARLTRCEQTVARMDAAIAGGGLSAIQQKHLRMYQAVEWASLAAVQVARRDAAGARATLKKGFDVLDAISPKGAPVYPRIRAIELYEAAAGLAIQERDDAGLERLVDEVRGLIATFAPERDGAAVGEYPPEYGQQLAVRALAGGVAVEKQVSGHLKGKFASARDEARAAYRDAWLGSISRRLELLDAWSRDDRRDPTEAALSWAETAAEAIPLLRDAGDVQTAGQLESSITGLMCGAGMALGNLVQEDRRVRICSALKG